MYGALGLSPSTNKETTINKYHRAWGDGLVDKNTCCTSQKKSEFESPALHKNKVVVTLAILRAEVRELLGLAGCQPRSGISGRSCLKRIRWCK